MVRARRADGPADQGPVRRMWAAMSGHGRELTGAALVGSAASLCAVALLGTAAWLISTAAGMPPVLTLTVAAVSVRFFALGRALFRYVERLVGHDAAFRGLASLRVRIYLALERVAPVGLARFTRGDLLTRLVADVDASLDLPLRVILPWVQAGIVLAACVAGLAWLLPGVGGWIAILGLLGLLAAPWLASALALRTERRVAPQRAELTGLVVTALNASPDLIAFGAADRALARIADADQMATGLMRRESIALGLGGGQAIVLQGLAVTGALAIGLPAVAAGTLTPPWLAVVVLVPLALFEVLGTLPSAALALQRLRGSADRLAEVEQAPDPVHRCATPRPWNPRPNLHEPWLEMEGVYASWRPEGPDVLHGITCSVPAGANLVIVGPSGSGKSTLAAILMGFCDYRGSVRLHGNEIRELDPDQLRTHLGYLVQRGHVFDTTIEENLRLGRTVSGESELWQALEQARLADAVRAMPMGLQTRVGVFGNALSGGEAQRLSIARLMLQPGSILLLDEPTEHLDALTAKGIDQTLDRIARGRIRILITHRVGAIPADDHVIVLQAGRLTESGRADDLTGATGWFADQWTLQEQQRDLAMLIESLPSGMGVPATWDGRP